MPRPTMSERRRGPPGAASPGHEARLATRCARNAGLPEAFRITSR